MTTNKKLIAAALATAIAIPAEGLRQAAYHDPAGILTICYGHTGPDVVRGARATLDQCRALLTEDMRKAVDQVDRCHPGLPAPVLAAFADAAFNLGPSIACDTGRSTAARHLYKGEWRQACDQLPRWDKARVLGFMVALPGLTTRRAAERELCLRGLA